MPDMEFKLIENLMVKHYNNLEVKMDLIAERAAKKAIQEVMPQLKSDLEDHLNNTMAKIVADKSKETVFTVTGEDLEDRGRCSVVRNAVQWAIRSANKSSIVMRAMLTVVTSSLVGAFIGMMLNR